jgi:hypothetical protein
MTNIESFVRKNKNKIATWQTRITVERTPATLADLDQESRWFKDVGHEVVSVSKVKVTCNSVTFPNPNPYAEAGF